MEETPHDSSFNVEAAMIRNALGQARRDRRLAARLLGITEAELENRIRASGLTMDESSGQ